MKNQTLIIAKLHADAKVPVYANEGDACFDFFALIEDENGLVIQPGEAVAIRTGLAVEIPKGWRLDIFGRSGLWFKNMVRLGNGVGKIDEGFRSEVMVSLHNMGSKPYTVKPFERIAQGELNEVTKATFEVREYAKLSETERGTGGLGSSGTH